MSEKPTYEELKQQVKVLVREGHDYKWMEAYIKKLNRLTEVLLGPGNLSKKLKHITDWVVDIFGSDFARIWIIKKGDLCEMGCSHATVIEGPHVCRYRELCLHLMASSGRYTHIDGSHNRVPFGCYKIGLVAAGDDPKFLTNDVTRDPRIHNHEWAKSLGLVSFAGYRLLSTKGKPIGVLSLFSKHTISPEEDALFEGLANATAQVIQSAIFEDAFQESEQEKEIILNSLVEHVVLQDTEMKIIWANRAACESANLTIEEIVGRHCYEIWPQQSEPCSGCPVMKAMKTDQPQAKETSTPDGRSWLIRGYPLRNRDGDIVGGIEVTLEITEQKQAEEAIRESEYRYSALVLESPDAIISLAKTGILLSFNPAAERISGLSAEEVIGKHFAKIGVLAKQSIPKALKEFALVITGIKRPPFELTIMNKDKSCFFMEANPRLIKHKGEKAWIQVTFRNITDRKLAEGEKKKLEAQLQQAQKIESIGTLAGGIAHDFNNILSSVIGYTELALDDAEEGTLQHTNLQEVLIAGDRAKDLVKQILTFARQSDAEVRPTKVSTIAKETLRLIRSTIPTSIEIKQNINSDSLIMVNPTLVHQIFMNLYTNAYHAMEDKGGILEVDLVDIKLDSAFTRLHKGLKPGDYLKLSVSDTGEGISPNIIELIFEPYFTTKKPGEGTGMGLAMVHGIVKGYGGEITVESKMGKGTVSTVYLPIAKKHIYIKPLLVEELPLGTERILFIDDEMPIVKMNKQALESLGYKVTTRTSSIEALQLFISKPNDFDLVITDMTMPNMNGDKLAGELMKIRPDIPIIISTGYSKKISDERAAEIGIKAVAMKPVSKTELANTIRKVLD